MTELFTCVLLSLVVVASHGLRNSSKEITKGKGMLSDDGTSMEVDDLLCQRGSLVNNFSNV